MRTDAFPQWEGVRFLHIKKFYGDARETARSAVKRRSKTRRAVGAARNLRNHVLSDAYHIE